MGQMMKKQTKFFDDVEHLEDAVFGCFGPDDDLPQTPDEDGVIIGLVQEGTGVPYHQVEGQFHHQIEQY